MKKSIDLNIICNKNNTHYIKNIYVKNYGLELDNSGDVNPTVNGKDTGELFKVNYVTF